jgi:hypothetical protein
LSEPFTPEDFFLAGNPVKPKKSARQHLRRLFRIATPEQDGISTLWPRHRWSHNGSFSDNACVLLRASLGSPNEHPITHGYLLCVAGHQPGQLGR